MQTTHRWFDVSVELTCHHHLDLHEGCTPEGDSDENQQHAAVPRLIQAARGIILVHLRPVTSSALDREPIEPPTD